jgi:hypothetical protein
MKLYMSIGELWSICILLFPEKEPKSVSSASQKATSHPELEADPGPRRFGGLAPKQKLI